eukprot:s4417_g11.t1
MLTLSRTMSEGHVVACNPSTTIVELDVVVVVLMLHISGHLVVVVDVSTHIEDTDVVQYNVIDEVNVAPEEAEVEDAEVVMVTCELFLERLLDLPRDDALAVEGGLSW